MQNIIAVLGMHRSGTSMLAGSLQQAGLYLGKVYAKNKFNQKGNRESPVLMRFHERLLEKNGGSWHSPPDTVKWSAKDKIEMEEFIQAFERKPKWGFKDPRSLFVIEGWQELIPNLKLVGIFRNPMSVAQSLNNRDNFSVQKGLNIWVKYNSKLLELHKLTEFPIIEFASDTDEIRRSISLLIDILELKRRHANDFFSDTLIHNRASINTALPAEVLSLYHDLQNIAIK